MLTWPRAYALLGELWVIFELGCILFTPRTRERFLGEWPYGLVGLLIAGVVWPIGVVNAIRILWRKSE